MQAFEDTLVHHDLPPARVLIAEDDPILRVVLRTMLSHAGYDVLLAEDGVQALALFEREAIDLVLLDVVMPHITGFDVCRRIRARSNVPILLLTSRSHTDDVVHGLELGADDYLAKPFQREELLARVRALLRRAAGHTKRVRPASVMVQGLHIDAVRQLATLDGRVLKLSPTEFKLLHFLAANAGQVFDRAVLFREVWGYEPVGDMNLVDVCVRRVREKIERNPSRPTRLLAVRGVGYKLADEQALKVGGQ
jgi:two-component system response regulator MtrA